MKRVRDMLRRLEGRELKPYRDTEGRLSIGIGRCLDTKGISADECEHLFDNDFADAVREAQTFSWFRSLDEVRQDVVITILFQLGLKGFRGFKKAIAAIERRDFTLAAAELLRSRWAEQTPKRARLLSKMMLTGSYPEDTDA